MVVDGGGVPTGKEMVVEGVVAGLDVVEEGGVGVTPGKEGWTAGVVTKEGAGGVEYTKEMMEGMAYLR